MLDYSPEYKDMFSVSLSWESYINLLVAVSFILTICVLILFSEC